MEPWVTLVLTGVAIAGYGWLLPKSGAKASADGSALRGEEAYDRLLEDLEAENRELLDAVAIFKKEQEEKVGLLSRRIRELEMQMAERPDRGSPADAPPRSAAQPPSQAPSDPAAVAAPPAAGEAADSTPVPGSEAGEEAGPAARSEEALAAADTIGSRYAELLDLHRRGRSIEQIAKTLGMNKGEVQLILQLARREEMQRA
ncbi:DUF6115 domain-containing protein [Cohnella thermotolerans]|uniref:DUF6115 domain-containing protein n=1 Tax=Cohnella thermotolerans TaxID=329858 RepID=UPI000403140D|nr:hypothetical protein [Cohnella thermotolerans]